MAVERGKSVREFSCAYAAVPDALKQQRAGQSHQTGKVTALSDS
ncbi:hypothetical protein BSU04_26825 [Caballeronia sordidicola]|uniref:Uncharacterized protein n=1 Tax=Caballeronia sordidicola TaxID=196367 RepID=A0A226WXF7_CABSO|nr:hypothetical protein BSU04_26825 [Caballeronia sordidicola]